MDNVLEQISGKEVKPDAIDIAVIDLGGKRIKIGKTAVPVIESNSNGSMKNYFKKADSLVERFKDIFNDSEEVVSDK